jgi:parallel beta-helix repeat protein
MLEQLETRNLPSGPPASVVVASGNSQTATVNTSFGNALVVTVKDQNGDPVADTNVTFASPASGASVFYPNGTVVITGSNGQASDTVMANTVAGTYIVTASVSGVTTPASFSLTNAVGAAAIVTKVLTNQQLTISPSTLASATISTPYNLTLSVAGGSGTYNFALTSGSLPAGLSLNSTAGVVSGTPTTVGTSSFTVSAVDANNASLTGSQDYALTVAASSGQTFYVATTGNDNNSGSASAPFKTLQHAMMSLQPGDTLDVEAGDYAGFIVGWDSVAASSGDQYGYIDGTASAPITIQAAPGTAAGSVIINSQNNETQAGIDLEPGCNYITISGITINGSSGGLAEYPNKGEGIKVAGSNNVVVANCTITDIDYGFGIIADNANNVMLLDNTITGTGGQGNPDYGHGIYISGSTNDAVVKGNVIDNNSYIGIHVNGDASEGGIGLVTNALIADNFIYNNGQNGINCDGIQSSTIENNVIYGYQGFGICLYQSDAAGPSENNVIVNNTIVSTVSGAGAAIRILDGGTGNTILNNISLGGGGIALRISSDSMSGLVSNYNIGGGVYQSEDTGDTETLAQWLTSTGQDAHSSTATAAQLFVNASASNYQLSSTSPAINAGTSTDAPSTDILGNPRPSGGGYDIGAYQD